MEDRADNYFVIIPQWVLFSNISPQALRLYGVLRSYADNQTLESWPSRKQVAKDLNVESEKTVDRATKELIEIGALKVTRRFYNGEPTTNLYTLISNKPDLKVHEGGVKDLPTKGQEVPTNYNHITKTKYAGQDKPDGLQVKNLIADYFENYPKGNLTPSRGQLVGQLQLALKEIPYEILKPLVIAVALEGQMLTKNTLIYAQNRLKTKPIQATPTPPKFDPAEFENPGATPMPSNFRDMVKQVRNEAVSPDK